VKWVVRRWRLLKKMKFSLAFHKYHQKEKAKDKASNMGEPGHSSLTCNPLVYYSVYELDHDPKTYYYYCG
jgi:hypothetical protein